MLTDIRNSKQSTQLSATLMKILVSGENQNVSNLGFHSLYEGRHTVKYIGKETMHLNKRKYKVKYNILATN